MIAIVREWRTNLTLSIDISLKFTYCREIVLYIYIYIYKNKYISNITNNEDKFNIIIVKHTIFKSRILLSFVVTRSCNPSFLCRNERPVTYKIIIILSTNMLTKEQTKPYLTAIPICTMSVFTVYLCIILKPLSVVKVAFPIKKSCNTQRSVRRESGRCDHYWSLLPTQDSRLGDIPNS
jgi:hypothetical protein